ncbi:hypothetical protein DFH06DRAFT_1009006, partial [Mycena polygramma]
PEPCTIRAWVRAQDLSPDHISHGELRIKVPRAECANQIASVALRLQLDEFGEVKFLKKGAVLPEVRPSNQSAPSGYADWTGSDVVYDYQAYEDRFSNPELWTVKAEERRAWTTQATLLDNNPGAFSAARCIASLISRRPFPGHHHAVHCRSPGCKLSTSPRKAPLSVWRA